MLYLYEEIFDNYDNCRVIKKTLNVRRYYKKKIYPLFEQRIIYVSNRLFGFRFNIVVVVGTNQGIVILYYYPQNRRIFYAKMSLFK